MKSQHPPELSTKDKAWQNSVEQHIKVENVKLGHTQGKERFGKAVRRVLKSKPQ
jgi:hypothetical protein